MALQLEFVAHLAAKGNQVFALARNPDQSKGLQELKGKPGITILKADITDPVSLRVRRRFLESRAFVILTSRRPPLRKSPRPRAAGSTC